MKSIATFAIAMLAGAAAFAQAPSPGTPDRQRPQREPMNRVEMESLVDARIAAIQGGLKLTSEQQRHWLAVEQAIRGMAGSRIARVEQRRERWARGSQADAQRPDFMERLERRSQAVNDRAAGMKALADAVTPLWASLDERQKRLLPVLMRPTMGGRGWRGGRMGHRGMMRHHMGERGSRR